MTKQKVVDEMPNSLCRLEIAAKPPVGDPHQHANLDDKKPDDGFRQASRNLGPMADANLAPETPHKVWASDTVMHAPPWQHRLAELSLDIYGQL